MKPGTRTSLGKPAARKPRRPRAPGAKAPSAEQDLRTVLEALPQGVCVHRDYKPLFVNAAFARLHGHSGPDEILVLDSILALMPPEQHALSRERVARRMSGRSAPERFHELQLRKDGSRFLAEKTLSVISWEGAPALLICLSEVTPGSQIAMALGESEQRLKDFAEVASDWFWETDREHRFTYISARFEEVADVDLGSRTGKRRWEVALPIAIPGFWERHIAELEARHPFRNLTYAYLDSQQRVRHVRVNGKPFFAGNGEFLGYRGTGTDITAEVEALERAEHAHRKLMDAVESIPAAFYIYDDQERLELANNIVRRMYPRTPLLNSPGAKYEDMMRWSVEHGELLTGSEDPDTWMRKRLEAFRNPPESFEMQLGDGRWIKGLDRKTADGGTVCIRVDISDEKQREAALRASQEALDAHRALLQAVLDAMPIWVFVKDPESRFVLVNRKMASDHGVTPEEYYRIAGGECSWVQEKERESFRAMDRRVIESGRQVDVPEERLTLPGGRVSFRHTIKVPLRDGQGRITGIVGVSEEINDRKHAEAELRASEERFRNLIEGSIQGILLHRANRPLFLNKAYARMFGYDSPEDVQAMPSLEDLIAPEDRARVMGYYHARVRGEPVPARYTFKGIRKDGSPIWVETLARVVDWEGGPAVQGTFFDVTERREAEERLRTSEKRFRDLVEGSIQGIIVHRNMENAFINEAFAKIFGYESVAELRALPSLRTLIAPREIERLVGYHCDRLQGKDAPVNYPWEGVRKDGSRVWLDAVSRLVDWDGSPAVQTTLFDITERREAEERLRSSEERFRNLVEGSIQGVVVHRNWIPLFVNEAFARIFGYGSVAELFQQPSLRVVVAPQDQERLYAYQRSRLEGGEAPAYYQFEGVRKDGSRVWLDAISRVVDWDGSPAVQSAMFDITQRKLLEEQLRQSQKMEAVGKLAGGIAHDFNNLLQVISGFTRLALADVPEAEPLHRDLEMIHQAAERAAGLTRQLLAFSRRQVLTPTELNLNDLVTNMVRLLERIIERHIQVTVLTDEPAPKAHADAGMIEQVLMNLCVNARDAMPSGGHLIIETKAVELDEGYCRQYPWAKPGRYATMAVTDTGVGIPPEVRERIFEPFFTTKEIGKGTGLGLSTVYGIMQQHEGFVTVDSSPGAGSTFRAYLPAAKAAPAAPGPQPAKAPPGGGETILVVEDEPGVQGVAARALTRQGYRVLTATDGMDALALLRAQLGRVDLVLLDLIMPHMTGEETYRRLREAAPGARVVFATGYSASVPQAAGEPAPALLEKPYSPEQLLAVVRSALDGR